MNWQNLKNINWKEVRVLDIIKGCGEGYLSDFLNREQDHKTVIKYRIEMCKKCSLNNEGYCDSSKKGTHVKTGLEKSGCGCNLRCKTALKSSTCPLGKWLAVK